MNLVLPLPDSPNRWAKHPMVQHRQKNAYRKACWAALIVELARQGRKPLRQPPERVRITATFYVVSKRDEDNLTASLKWLLDAVKQKQTGNIDWRQGIATECGLIVDDDPAHLEVPKPEQFVDRKRPRVEITVTPLALEDVA